MGPPLAVPRAAGRIEMDGKLDDAAWQQAAVLDTFCETYPADNTEPAAKTVVYLTYDDSNFYVGIHAFDPEPGNIRAPFVERDNTAGTDDNIAVFLDTRNDRRSAVEFRVNPRGNQTDATARSSRPTTWRSTSTPTASGSMCGEGVSSPPRSSA